MWSPLNGHLELISFILTKHCLIREGPLFSLYGLLLDLVGLFCFLFIDNNGFIWRHQKSASKTLCNVSKYQFNYLGNSTSWIKA